MGSILSDLYNGELLPSEICRPKTEEYKRAVHSQIQRQSDFAKRLRKCDPKLEEEFWEIVEEKIDNIPCEMETVFKEGFRMGAKIILEIFEKEK